MLAGSAERRGISESMRRSIATAEGPTAATIRGLGVGGDRKGMRCRHTVADWHRYAESPEDGPAIAAGCRLLVKEGEQARDPRSIACAYWGHQRDCPLYEGPGERSAPFDPSTVRTSLADVPVDVTTVWPVRRPPTADGMRLLLIGSGAVSAVMLLWTATLALLGLALAGMGFARRRMMN